MVTRQKLSIDIETYSGYDLREVGVYKYVEHPDFAILLFAYAFDDEDVQVIDFANGDILPEKVYYALKSENVEKCAHNANFERTCIAKEFAIKMPPEQWSCTMVKAAQCGLPLKLETVAQVLKLSEKLSTGKALIKYFCQPCKATKVNGERTRNMPSDAVAKWEEFKKYCVQDVVVEREIRQALEKFIIPQNEVDLWHLDQHINDRGITVDTCLVEGVLNIDSNYSTQITAEIKDLTQLNNPNSVSQLTNWLNDNSNLNVTKLTKEAVVELIAEADCESVKRVLTIRQELSKTSIKKYFAMQAAICEDQRVRGLLQYCGANRTWRWAGRLIQVQNLPRIQLKDIGLARQLVRQQDGELLAMLYGNVPNVLSQLIRTAFVARPGHRLLVSDFSAIEARVIAWIAGEEWRMEVFRTHGKIYEASAAQMFKLTLEQITEDLRQKGKVSELALGYQGAVDALIRMGALKMGLSEEELPDIVKFWRSANKRIVKLWKTVSDAAILAIESGKVVSIQKGIKFFMRHSCLHIKLPSGRCLVYYAATLKEGKFGPVVTYMGMNQETKVWGWQTTYGGKLVENIVQAVSRDCLAYAMMNLEESGYPICMHVHDEVVAELPKGVGSIEDFNATMEIIPPWAEGLPLQAKGFETEYYKKD
jgi:DNA polymerase bacteriophage-type